MESFDFLKNAVWAALIFTPYCLHQKKKKKSLVTKSASGKVERDLNLELQYSVT